MTLSKLEIQQMLREMKIRFHADDTYDELKHRLQQENRSQWLKSVTGEKSADGRSGNILVRKRKKDTPSQDPARVPPDDTAAPDSTRRFSPHADDARHSRAQPAYHRQAIEKPAPGKPWKAVSEGTEPFNRKKHVFESVLKRARRCCEHCGVDSQNAPSTSILEPFHIVPLDQGGEHSVKNVVALCPSCLAAMQDAADPKSIKELKRKTRSRIYDSLQVVKKKKGRGLRK